MEKSTTQTDKVVFSSPEIRGYLVSQNEGQANDVTYLHVRNANPYSEGSITINGRKNIEEFRDKLNEALALL